MLLKERTYAHHDPISCRYSVDLGGGDEAFLEYEMRDDLMHITYTEVPTHLRGQGLGRILMEACLESIENEGYSIVPICNFVVVYLVRHPQWSHLVVSRR